MCPDGSVPFGDFDAGATLNWPTLGGANATADNRLLTGTLALRL